MHNTDGKRRRTRTRRAASLCCAAGANLDPMRKRQANILVNIRKLTHGINLVVYLFFLVYKEYLNFH